MSDEVLASLSYRSFASDHQSTLWYMTRGITPVPDCFLDPEDGHNQITKGNVLQREHALEFYRLLAIRSMFAETLEPRNSSQKHAADVGSGISAVTEWRSLNPGSGIKFKGNSSVNYCFSAQCSVMSECLSQSNVCTPASANSKYCCIVSYFGFCTAELSYPKCWGTDLSFSD